MAYGNLRGWRRIVRPFVQGQRVWDYGAGDLALAMDLVRLGAARVEAVDKHGFRGAPSPVDRIVLHAALFMDAPWPEPDDVGFVSYPANHLLPGLVERVAAMPTLIYLGENNGWTVCGWPGLWDHLLRRELRVHRQRRNQTLMVLGPVQPDYREPVGDECFLLETWEPAWGLELQAVSKNVDSGFGFGKLPPVTRTISAQPTRIP